MPECKRCWIEAYSEIMAFTPSYASKFVTRDFIKECADEKHYLHLYYGDKR
jgi:hypothetical protein